MNWRDAKKSAKEIFPLLKPTRAAGFTTDEHGNVLITGYDESICVVLTTETDRNRLATMIKLAEIQIKKKERKP